ncbi:MAG: ribosome recycling factor [Candidatus Omnitrophota bacterium]
MKEVKKDIEGKMQKALDATRREMSEVRTGRAHPGLIEGIHVDYYGTPTLLKTMASITIPDPRTIVIQPWDPSVIQAIEKALLNSSLGVTPAVDGKIIRVGLPQLSAERRQEMQKLAKHMAEQGRVSLRTIRREANEKIKKMQSESLVSEDEGFRAQEEIQKLTDKYIKEIDEMIEKKIKELVEI